MKLIIINGSPRGTKSNSKVISDWIRSSMGDDIMVFEFFVKNQNTHELAIKSIDSNTTILMVFPLYTDAMPAILKLFIEKLEMVKSNIKNANVYFIVQSGFQGANHSRYVEKYLAYFASYFSLRHMGTAIKPSGEGLRSMPKFLTKKTAKSFTTLGQNIIDGKQFDEKILKKLAQFEKPNMFFKFIINKTKISNYYMDSMLKKNGVYDNRLDKPYLTKDQ